MYSPSSVPAAVVAVALSAGLLAACSSTPGPPGRSATTAGAGAATTTPATTAASPPTTAAGPPTTTAYAPGAPQPSPDAAAAALVNDWSTGNRGAAATVATPDAVNSLFSQPYPAGYIQPRGCTDPSAVPGTCTYANRQTGALYEITVTRAGSEWYVLSVSVES